MNTINYIIGAGIVVFTALVWYLIDQYVRRYYYLGYRAAYKYVRLYPATKETLKNIKGFLDLVFSEALGGLKENLESNLSLIRAKIETLEKSIQSLQEKKNTLVADINVLDEGGDDKKYEEMESRLNGDIKSTTEKLSDLNNQLAVYNDLYNKEIAKKREQKTLQTSQWISGVITKIRQLSNGFPAVMWFALFLLILDYFLALKFFGDALEGSFFGSFVFILPAGITFGCMYLVHLFTDQIKQIRGRDEIDIFDYALLAIYGASLAAIFAFIMILRVGSAIETSSGIFMIAIEALLSILFGVFVILVSHLVDANNKKLYSLIITPAGFIISAIALVFAIILWPFEKLLVTLSSKNKAGLEIASFEKNIQDCQQKIEELKKEKSQKSNQIASLPQQKTDLKLKEISDARKIKFATLQPVLSDIDGDIVNKKRDLEENKVKEKKLQRPLLELRNGSDHGAMAALYKKKMASPAIT